MRLFWKLMKIIFGPARCSVPEPKFDKTGKLIFWFDISSYERKYGYARDYLRTISRK